MSHLEDKAMYEAVRQAMKETVAQFGISYVRTLSFFPSAREEDLKKAA